MSNLIRDETGEEREAFFDLSNCVRSERGKNASAFFDVSILIRDVAGEGQCPSPEPISVLRLVESHQR